MATAAQRRVADLEPVWGWYGVAWDALLQDSGCRVCATDSRCEGKPPVHPVEVWSYYSPMHALRSWR